MSETKTFRFQNKGENIFLYIYLSFYMDGLWRITASMNYTYSWFFKEKENL